jgi:hypothetical protein
VIFGECLPDAAFAFAFALGFGLGDDDAAFALGFFADADDFLGLASGICALTQ